MARLTRAQFLQLRAKGYVEAAVYVGSLEWRIILRYIFPNVLTLLWGTITSSRPFIEEIQRRPRVAAI